MHGTVRYRTFKIATYSTHLDIMSSESNYGHFRQNIHRLRLKSLQHGRQRGDLTSDTLPGRKDNV